MLNRAFHKMMVFVATFAMAVWANHCFIADVCASAEAATHEGSTSSSSEPNSQAGRSHPCHGGSSTNAPLANQGALPPADGCSSFGCCQPFIQSTQSSAQLGVVAVTPDGGAFGASPLIALADLMLAPMVLASKSSISWVSGDPPPLSSAAVSSLVSAANAPPIALSSI